MTAREDPLLRSAVEKVVTAFSAACHIAQDEVDLGAWRRLVARVLSADEARVIQNIGERRLALEIAAEVMKRRAEKCWPHRLRAIRKPVPN